MGPWLVTADEVGDVTALELETQVNGEIRQKACVADLIFDIPTLIETLSAAMTLLPGDIIATGTPEGVGIGFQPAAVSRSRRSDARLNYRARRVGKRCDLMARSLPAQMKREEGELSR